MTKKTPVFEISPVPTDGTCKDETKKKIVWTHVHIKEISIPHILYTHVFTVS